MVLADEDCHIDWNSALGFCLTLRLIASPAGPGDLGPCLHRKMGWSVILLSIDKPFLPEETELPKHVTRGDDRAITIVGALVLFMRDVPLTSYTRQQWSRFTKSPRELVATFTAQISNDISLLRSMDLPLPFTKPHQSSLSTSYLPVMTSPEYIKSAEWIGIYTISFGLGAAPRRQELNFDYPMHGIRFEVTQLPTDSTRLNLRAAGTDGVGSFTLDGVLSQKIGYLQMLKAYGSESLEWRWSCIMTPFGIVGTWGSSDYGGWVWLWRLPPK